MASALIGGAALGAAFGELMKVAVDVAEKTINFKSELGIFVSILNSLAPIVLDIEGLNKKLDVPEEETKTFTHLLKKATDLVRKCSKFEGLNCIKRFSYSRKLMEFGDSLEKFFQIYVQAVQTRDNKKILVKVNELEDLYGNILVKVNEMAKWEMAELYEKFVEKATWMDLIFDEKMIDMKARLDEKMIEMFAMLDEEIVENDNKIDAKLKEIYAKLDEKMNEMEAKLDEKWSTMRKGGWVYDWNIAPATNHLHFKAVDVKVEMDSDECERGVIYSVISMEGVKSVEVNRKQNRVTVSGYVDPNMVLKKVKSTGKRAEFWAHMPYNFPEASNMTEERFNIFSDENANGCSIM
ncbi:uncharacterized protein LOC132316591 [Cornus florida]|uniref:uncharacterized protein LOC132316591 n=1 Tax=Cornus florida TaxID=4283 RepID=UPI002898151F|nr:uncharacterized protein LOC132316591 [Cornus florida]